MTTNIHIPKLLLKVKTNSQTVLYYEYCPGKTLDSFDFINLNPQQQKIIHELIKVLADITYCNFRGVSKFILMVLGIYTSSRSYIIAILNTCLKLKVKAGIFYLKILKFNISQLVFSHGDLHCKNIIISPGWSSITIIDWDISGYYPLGYDIFRLLHHLPIRLQNKYLNLFRLSLHNPPSKRTTYAACLIYHLNHEMRHSLKNTNRQHKLKKRIAKNLNKLKSSKKVNIRRG